MNAMNEIFGNVIYAYTRKQAIEDGVLVDLSYEESDTASVCREHYKHPIACTAAVFDLMRKAVENPRYSNNYVEILYDILWMSRAMKRQLDESTVIFPVIIAGAGRQRNYEFKLNVGPGDDGEPVITIMLPAES